MSFECNYREVNKGSLTIEYLIYQGQEYPLNKEE